MRTPRRPRCVRQGSASADLAVRIAGIVVTGGIAGREKAVVVVGRIGTGIHLGRLGALRPLVRSTAWRTHRHSMRGETTINPRPSRWCFQASRSRSTDRRVAQSRPRTPRPYRTWQPRCLRLSSPFQARGMAEPCCPAKAFHAAPAEMRLAMPLPATKAASRHVRRADRRRRNFHSSRRWLRIRMVSA